MTQESEDFREFFNACASGDSAARRRFQEEYGEDIYNFPVKIYGAPLEDAGDFYVYAFERDRIFLRLKTFEGRNSIQFRTFLSYYVLKHLFLEWRRTQKEVDTISLQTPLGNTDEGERTLEDVLPTQATPESEEQSTVETEVSGNLWTALSPEERLDLKLLSLLECDLTSDEIRLLAKVSGRSLRDTLDLVIAVQDGLKRKDEKVSRLRDDLDSVWGWILLRQKELQESDKKLRLLSTEASLREKLSAQKQELEKALAKRYRQRERIMQEIRTYKLTTPYKDIAQLLNLTVGTVCSRIFRLRERLVREFAGRGVLEEQIQ
ncbi:MAG: sigma-70 family RNA polymerase sigma factor [Candidatus Binatia bacterium]